MRRRIVTVSLPAPLAEPAYPEYKEVRAEAERRSRGPIDPSEIQRVEDLVHRRGRDWCTAVLGHPYAGIRSTSHTDSCTLLVADERGLEPPLPPRIVEERKAREAAEAEREEQARERRAQEQRRWDLVVAAAPVELTVRENTRHTGVGGSLRHAVPEVELRSGRSRRHLPGRALCETPGRANPLLLGEPVSAPANCVRCLEYAAQVRTLDAPAPPTAAEQALMKLIAEGSVFTLRPGRGQPTIRVTTERSHGVAWGHLGRKVDAAVKKLEKKGWAAADTEHSATQTGHYGQRWRLTKSGTATLEG